MLLQCLPRRRYQHDCTGFSLLAFAVAQCQVLRTFSAKYRYLALKHCPLSDILNAEVCIMLNTFGVFVSFFCVYALVYFCSIRILYADFGAYMCEYLQTI